MSSQTLSALCDTSIDLRVGGEEIQIRAFRFGQLPRVLNIIGAAGAALMAHGQIDISALLEQDAEKVIDLCILATGRPREWFDSLDAAEGLQIAAAIVEVNADFFDRRVRPLAADLWIRMKSRFPALTLESGPTTTAAAAGPTPSSC